MSLFNPRVFTEIAGEMRNRLIAVTPLTDINAGSVFTTMLEAAAQEDDEQYFQMLEIIRGYSLDTTSGEDLDDRAEEYGIIRLPSQTASTVVTIGDSGITKISTGVYSGLPGSPAGATFVRGDSATGFPTSGTIIVGRGTPNAETVPYTSISVATNYVTFNLGAGLAFDHGTDESIILSQGGNRLIVAGTVVIVPASDINAQIDYTLDANATILDGESEVTLVAVTASSAGSEANVPVGAIQQFDSLPFSTATVTNTSRVTNGRDEETDQELRDRIKDTIQSLSRGTGKSITTGILNIISSLENKRVVSAALVEPTNPANVVKLYIDDGTGFIPIFEHVGFEEVVASATGGERYLRINNVPIMKAFVKTENEEPYNMSAGNLTLFVEVGGAVETITFQSTDFVIAGAASAQEIVKKINSSATSFEARLAAGEATVRIFARADQDEQIRVTGGTANAILGFPTDTKFTTKLYRKRDNVVKLLNKDGTTAIVESGNTAGYNMTADRVLCVVIDGKNDNPQFVHFFPSDFTAPVSVGAEDIVPIINDQLAGAIASASSNDTRVSLASNIKRSSTSKIRFVETFSKVFTESGLVFTDVSADVQTDSSNVPLWAADGDHLYLGHSDVRFGSVWFNLNTVASAVMGFVAEYWNGSTWKSFGVSDDTNGFTQSGMMLFKVPFNWAATLVNGTQAYWVRIRRVQPVLATNPIESRVKVCSGNEIFGFSETEVAGTDKDYTLNRFIGQIELVEPLSPLDQITLGSYDSRAQVVAESGPYGLVGGESLNVEIDGVPFVIPFVALDFFTPGAALPAEVADKINTIISGGVADTVDSGTKVRILSNKWDGGTVQVTGGTANNFLQFPIDLSEAFIPHFASTESIAEPFVFSPSQSLVIIMDENGANNFTVPTFNERVIQSATVSTLTDTTLSATFPLAEDLADHFEAYIIDGAQAGERQDILSYVPGTGVITLAAPLSGAPNPNDKFQIFPKDAAGVVAFWNNRQITLISVEAEVSLSSGGTKVQIASLVPGEEGSVQVTGGTANAVLGFSTATTFGVDGYRYFTGLAQVTQWTVDGRDDDQDTYPGIRAAGVQVEVIEPVKVPIRIELDVTTREGVSLGSITNDVKSAVSSYINALPVGADVIISEIVCAVKEVSGVFDVKVTSPTANIAIADNELARIVESLVVVG